MTNHIFIQARINSTRLPGKILKRILGKTILELLVERLRNVNQIDKIVLVTGPAEKNYELIAEAKRIGIEYFSGSEENVLDRFYKASNIVMPDNIIRVTADCPLIDFNVICEGLTIFLKSDYDILSNSRIKSYPHGFEFEIFTKKALRHAWETISKKIPANEFNTVFVNPTEFMLHNNKFRNYDLINSKDLSHIRLTLDYHEDLELITIIFETLYVKNKKFALNEILELIDKKPFLLNINNKFVSKQQQGYA
jgi:spore coat polysaccharide biosynthesis protein SpsF